MAAIECLVNRLIFLEPRLEGVLNIPSRTIVESFFDSSMVHHGGGVKAALRAGDGSAGDGSAGIDTMALVETPGADDAIVPPGTLALYRALLEDPDNTIRSPPVRLSSVAADVVCRTPHARLKQRPPPQPGLSNDIPLHKSNDRSVL